MHPEAPHLSRRVTRVRFTASVALLCIAACSQSTDSKRGSQSSEIRETPKSSDTQSPPPDKNSPRTELSIGYSLLYQEANGLPQLKWLLMFKDKPKEMARVTDDLIKYYKQLADTMRKLSKQYPAMRIDVAPMSEIEANERKALGEDRAKDFAPVVGKGGVAFEREALLMFYNGLTSSVIPRRCDGAARNRPWSQEVLGDYQAATGRALRESQGVIEPPLFYTLNRDCERDDGTSGPTDSSPRYWARKNRRPGHCGCGPW